jgi:uncharacterized protein (TIGR00251 family)
VVEGTPLLRVHTGKTCIEGSNPSFSASLAFSDAWRCNINPARTSVLRGFLLSVAMRVAGNTMKRKKSEFKGFCGWDGATLVLNILGTPNANKDAIGKPKGNQLCVSVTATPVAGRATEHMVRFLALEFGVLPDAIEVVFGRLNVNKQLRIHAPKRLPVVVSKHCPLPS